MRRVEVGNLVVELRWEEGAVVELCIPKSLQVAVGVVIEPLVVVGQEEEVAENWREVFCQE